MRQNAHASLLALAKQLGMPASTIHAKARRYHGSIIIKQTVLLDFAKLGYSRTYLAIKTSPAGRCDVQALLAIHRGVNNLQKINSGFDFLAEIIAKNPKELEDFVAEIQDIPGVIGIQRFAIIEDIIRESFMLNK